MASTIDLNFSASISAKSLALVISNSSNAVWWANAATWDALFCSKEAVALMVSASEPNSDCLTSALPWMSAAWALAFASAVAWPVDSTAADAAWSSKSCRRAFSASASSWIFWRSNLPLACCSRRSASCLASASWDLVVISMANCTDFCKASLVRESTGSTDWISMLVMTRLLALNTKRLRGLPSWSVPNTASRIIWADPLWKLSKEWAATIPRTREAIALQASPTKSGTEKIAADFPSSFASYSKKPVVRKL